MNGDGKLELQDHVYEGQFHAGKKEGKGKVIYTNGQGYDGYWRNNMMDGEGTWIFPNGLHKNGCWCRGERKSWKDEE